MHEHMYKRAIQIYTGSLYVKIASFPSELHVVAVQSVPLMRIRAIAFQRRCCCLWVCSISAVSEALAHSAMYRMLHFALLKG